MKTNEAGKIFSSTSIDGEFCLTRFLQGSDVVLEYYVYAGPRGMSPLNITYDTRMKCKYHANVLECTINLHDEYLSTGILV